MLEPIQAALVDAWNSGGGDPQEVTLRSVRRMKEESEVPVRSHGSLSLNRALMAAGLVDRPAMMD